MTRKLTIEIIIAFFILLFIYAAVSKLIDVTEFRLQLGQSPVLENIAGIVAITVPAAEIILSCMLTTTRWRLIGLYGSFSIMAMFTGYIIIITNYSDFVPCSCGGVLQKLSWEQHMVFNLFCVGLAAFAVLIHPSSIERKYLSR